MGLVPATVHSGLKVKLAQMRVKTAKASKTSFKIALFQQKENFEIFNLFQKMNYKLKKVFMASTVLKLVADVKMMNFVVEIPANA